MLRTILFFTCFALTLLDCRAQSSAATDVYKCGDNGYACFRIPALIRAADGTLLAFAEARRNGTSDRGDIDLVVRRSQDGGRTWGEMMVIWDDAENTCGNPAPVVVRETGRIVLLACWNGGADQEGSIELGKSKNTRRVFSIFSDDHGLTWSEPREITSSVKRPGWTWYATGPCHAIQKVRGPHKGRLVFPANHKWVSPEGTVVSNSHLIYSDDRGETWHIGAVSQPGGNESSVVELSNGDLMLNMRHYDPKDLMRLCGVSCDGGETWSRTWEETQLIEPRCQGSILGYSFPGDKPSRTLLFSNPRSLRRENMSIGVSRDDGRTWSRFVTVWKGRAAYSDMVYLPGGAIGILYENGDPGGKEELYRRITFDVVTPAQLFE
ncbi:sialidase family protein [uncultured Alistipes sp.]|jgi:hypothetical protein|uniref:sialidase family protein n=1 Tax=uncultured Alistipes sp. TaxID=538949 RepID=UPI0025E096A2|nr:sialidase family protein [uncultured Alistipes sp.]